MKVNIKNGELLDAILPAVEELGKEKNQLLALKTRTILRILRPRAQDILELRGDLIDRFGKKDEDGKVVLDGTVVQFEEPDKDSDEPSDKAKFLAGQLELLSGGWDYPGPQIVAKDLGDTQVTGKLLAALGDLFVEPTEPAEEKESE